MTNIIRSIREALQLSQSQLAEKFNIPVSSIQSWEHGLRRPPAYVPEMMIRISQLESELAMIQRPEEDFQALDDKGASV